MKHNISYQTLDPCRGKRLTTSLMRKVIRLNTLPAGSFNPGLASFGDHYIMVYRPNEEEFVGCYLDKEFNVSNEFKFNLGCCADPRLCWVDDKLYMIWSAIDLVKGKYPGCRVEHIKGSLIWNKEFIQPNPIRISPPGERQKNWSMFIHNDKLYLIGTIKPHMVYEWNMKDQAELVYKTEWKDCWMFDEFFRGNTNPVLLEDGNFLSTFHTVVRNNYVYEYTNGFYMFEGKPPFKPIACANRSYLTPQDAIEPSFRKKGQIKVCFPCGMVREGNRLLIGYGDQDSCVKILDTTVSEALSTIIKL